MSTETTRLKIPLTEWAARHYSPAPSAYVLRCWVRAGQIDPVPEKVGAAYYVVENAIRRLKTKPTLVQRLQKLEHA